MYGVGLKLSALVLQHSSSGGENSYIRMGMN